MNYEEEKRRYVSYCGSYCRTCDWFTGKVRKTFKSSLGMLGEYKFKKLFDGKVNGENFKLGLEILSNSGICSGCKAELIKNPDEDRCKIRQCAFSKGFALCSECPEFPCEMLRSKPGVVQFHCIENLKEIKESGIKRFIDNQWEEYTDQDIKKE